MTSPAIHPDAITDALPDLDAEVACEYALCDHPQCQCEAPAVWRVSAHCARNIDELRAGRCSTFSRPMCDAHLTELRRSIADTLRDRPGRCVCCGRRIAQVSDVLLEVSAL
ncbi:hypothetical protein SEA_RUTHY_53 [Gordonia phage Ruthy]|uniref:Uncharacterized protein n=1 Tax=Gordonia phage Ruthy TaxID=2250323 RepID=A0A345L5G4_9CAUD|nr:tail fiber protein [Gordonia phage Ruthy]AXH50516.1 hypothetical protein SEA_RUTHY_53 [Gordonia phage Ruthy]